MTVTGTELIFAAIAILVAVVGVVGDHPFENVVAAALVPMAMGLAHRAILRARAK